MSTRYSSRPTPTRGPVAPLHRGPQAMPQQATVAAQYVHAPNAALLIDFDNVTMGIRSDLQSELKNLLGSDIVKGKVSVQRAYADWRRYPQYIVPLSESSIDLIFAPAYGSSKKNATDIRLAIDALELVFTRPEIGTFILLSGDSDFSSLVIKLKEYGKYVIGVGIRESSSDLLVQNCDEYYSYNALAGLVKQGDEEAVKRDPWELVAEAIDRMQRNGDVMRSDRLKQVMQEIDSTFDEKDLGMAKFSRFVQEAAARGLVTVTKLENGQLEVTPARGRAGPVGAGTGDGVTAVAGAPPQQQDAARGGASPNRGAAERTAAPRDAVRDTTRDDEDAAEERGRRGRRGGRGRGRERADRDARDGREPREGREGRETRLGDVTSTEELAAASGAPPAPTADARVGAPGAAAVSGGTAAPAGRTAQGRDHIGVAGERLTRNEAFDLVRRSVESLVHGEAAASAQRVREAAFGLLGRDSESLSERNFRRILQDAHDADVIDLRRRGDDYEVALAQPVASVADQLNIAAAAVQSAAAAAAPAPPAPRGMGPRAGGGRGRGPIGARAGSPPPELLSVGVVDFDPASRAGSPAQRPVAPAASGSPMSSVATPAVSAPTPAVPPTEREVAAAESAAPERGAAPADQGGVADVTARPRARGGRGSRGRGRAAASAAPPAESTSPELGAAGESAPSAAPSPSARRADAEPDASSEQSDEATAPARGRRTARKRGAGRAAGRGAGRAAASASAPSAPSAASDVSGPASSEPATDASPSADEPAPRRRRGRTRASTSRGASE
jgi:uncharacterized protein (TIGR00288 family)